MPDFSLADADGRVFTRADVAGPHGLLVVFACKHCPYVIHLADALGVLARELGLLGVGTVAVNSNDTASHPEDSPEFMKEFAARHRWDFPYLIDASQDVAVAHGAACTPDFFLADEAGRLFYTGQFDATRPRGGQVADGGDLREAVRRMRAGEPPPARPCPSSGCNIKWRPGNQPRWWNAGG
jgi:peroxiredoxin